MTLSNYPDEELNKAVMRWGFKTRMQLKASIGRLSMKGKGELVKSLQFKARKDFGEIDRAIFGFTRHGVFFHKGVGRGYIMVNGKVVRGERKDQSHSANKPDNALIHAVQGPLRRQPKEWFNPVFAKSVPELADIIAKTKADHIFDPSQLKLRT